MTAPIRPLVKSLDGRSARELYAIERTNDNGEPTNPPTTGAPQPPVVTLPFQTGGDVDVFLAPGSGEVDTLWPAERFDARGNNQMRVVTNVAAAGGASAELFAQSSINGASWATPGTSDVAQSIAAVGPKPLPNQGWINIDPASIADMLWRLRLRGGDGAASPALWGSMLQFRNKVANRPTTFDPLWGSEILDLDPIGALFAALGYGDGDDAPLFPDETGIGHDFASAAGLLLPTYHASGFNGGSNPYIEWAGGNVPLTTPDNPLAAYPSYTLLIIAEGLDGGDGAQMWGNPGSNSFNFDVYFDDANISVANNNVGGSPGFTASDDWGMSTGHQYRFVKNAGTSSHQLFVDGVLKGTATNAPQTNNPGLIQLMYDLGGVGLSGRIAKVKAWDKAHSSPTNIGAVANGLTPFETAYQTRFGTP